MTSDKDKSHLLHTFKGGKVDSSTGFMDKWLLGECEKAGFPFSKESPKVVTIANAREFETSSCLIPLTCPAGFEKHLHKMYKVKGCPGKRRLASTLTLKEANNVQGRCASWCGNIYNRNGKLTWAKTGKQG